jgi:acyl dehydratase
MAGTICWEDLRPGEVRELGTTSVSAEEIKEFARRYDPQPFHVDEEAARHSIFGSLCASGWQTCALAMRLTVDNFLRHSTSQGSPGLENLRWMKPVYPGDQLTLRYVILESRPMRKRADTGLVRSRWEMFNQHGEQVLQMEGWGMFRRRHAATAEELAQDAARRD